MTTSYTYSIFDGNPSDSGTLWPTHSDVAIEAESTDGAIEMVRDILSTEAAGLNTSDGYSVGDTLRAIVWGTDGTIVGEPTYELTADDLGVEEDFEEDDEEDDEDDESGLRPDADTSHETAEQWWQSLGYWTTDDDGDQVAHPVCRFDEVLDFEPGGAAQKRLLKYAETARTAAESIITSLDEAIAAYHAGDLDGVVSALRDARQVEQEYGDEPATRGMADSLLVGGYASICGR